MGPMGGCTGTPQTDFLAPLSVSPLPPASLSLGTELARLELRWRSEWSSLRLRRILPCGSLMLLLRHRRLITFWDTASSKRCRCFLGMKILANMVACEEGEGRWKEESGAVSQRESTECRLGSDRWTGLHLRSGQFGSKKRQNRGPA